MANWLNWMPDPSRPGAGRLFAADGSVSPLVREQDALAVLGGMPRPMPMATSGDALADAGGSAGGASAGASDVPAPQWSAAGSGGGTMPAPPGPEVTGATSGAPPAPIAAPVPAAQPSAAAPASAEEINAAVADAARVEREQQDVATADALRQMGWTLKPVQTGPMPIGVQREVHQQTIGPEGAMAEAKGARDDYIASLRASQERLQAMAAQRNEELRKLSEEATAAQQQGIADMRATHEQLANERIDPERFWASRSTGQKIAAAIGVGLGAIGSAMTRSPNAAQEIIDRAVEQDIEAQKIRLQHLRIGADQKQALLDKHAQVAWKAVENTLQRYAGLAQDEEQRFKFDAMIADARAKSAAEDMARDSTQVTSMTQTPIYKSKPQPPAQAQPQPTMPTQQRMDPAVWSAMSEQAKKDYVARNPGAPEAQPKPKPIQGRAPGGATVNASVASTGANATNAAIPQGKWALADKEQFKVTTDQWEKQNATFVPALGGFVQSPERARELIDSTNKAAEVQARISEIQRLAAGTGEDIPGTDKNARIKTLLTNLQLKEKDVEKLGVLAGPDMELLRSLTGEIGTWKNLATNDMLVRLEQLNRILVDGRARLRQTEGLVPGYQKVVKDPLGRSWKMPVMTGQPHKFSETQTGRGPGQ